ncbi:MAG: peptidase [Methanomicrobia archaeon]|nr:peptidase [Methanomicrobia archaeon]MBS1194897.1 peptidase [Methanomicrobia archaeon]MDD1638966.1 slipin family protein [Methanomicrobiales archaeon]MDD1646157.1 slipin family protein [Methanomicrobiales archaeon]MDD1647163.1 slipin family protein [Methanomicrobiales archaeon]
MPERTPLQILIFTLIFLFGVWMAYSLVTATGNLSFLWVAVIMGAIGLLIAAAFKIADQWERAVVLRLGNFRGLQGPGPFFIIPLVERVAYWIDHRIITTTFKAEKTLTKDTVPVDVEAVLFWKVVNTEKAALAVEDYRSAISWASQTALREVIGKSFLADMLEGREKLDKELQVIIDLRTEQWGVKISSVEIRDILIPTELQDAMSMQAQAERERQARIILGDSEKQVAAKFEEAARSYVHNPTALHLRAMNMLFEGLKTRGAMMVVVPASILDSMSLGDTTGIVALARTMEEEKERKEEMGEGGETPPPGQKGKKPGY